MPLHAKRALLVAAVALLGACAIAIERYPTGPVVFVADVIMAVLGGVFAPSGRGPDPGARSRTRPHPPHRAQRRFGPHRQPDNRRAGRRCIGYWWTPARHVLSRSGLRRHLRRRRAVVPPHAIDHERARGFAPGQPRSRRRAFCNCFSTIGPCGCWRRSRPPSTLPTASMLPLIGQKLALAHPGLRERAHLGLHSRRPGR